MAVLDPDNTAPEPGLAATLGSAASQASENITAPAPPPLPYGYHMDDTVTSYAGRTPMAHAAPDEPSRYMPIPSAIMLMPYIVAIVMLGMAILLLVACGILLCKLCLWKRDRRRRLEQHAARQGRMALDVSLVNSMRSCTYQELMETNKKCNGTSDAESSATGDAVGRSGEGPVADCEEPDTCNVCLCDFEPDEIVRQVPCGHFFHNECVDPWLQKNGTCPTCRWANLKSADNQRLPSEGASRPTRVQVVIDVPTLAFTESQPAQSTSRLDAGNAMLTLSRRLVQQVQMRGTHLTSAPEGPTGVAST